MYSQNDEGLIACLCIPPEARTAEDLAYLYSQLRSIDTLSSYREQNLRELCRTIRYERHEAGQMLYRRGELCPAWYILLSGSVLIDTKLFLRHDCFGSRTNGSRYRHNDCVILELTDLIVINYPEVAHTGTHRRAVTGTRHGQHGRTPDPSVQPASPCPSPSPVQSPNSHQLTPMTRRVSHASDTSSCSSDFTGEFGGARSGSPRGVGSKTGSSTYSPSVSVVTTAPSTLGSSAQGSSSFVDSDDEGDNEEDLDSSSHETQSLRDGFWDCLLKEPADRSKEDVETLMESVQNLPAFSNLTQATRRALCAVMVIAVVKDASQLVINNGEALDAWTVVLNGTVEVRAPDGTIRELTRGDAFGVRPTSDLQKQVGDMVTVTEDCHFACVTQTDFIAIMGREGEAEIPEVDEGGGGRTVLVYEESVLDGGSRRGRLVVKGTPEKLIGHLMSDPNPVDTTYTEDFLLTFRTFLDSPQPILDRLIGWYQQEEQDLRTKVKQCVLRWVNNHFNDFETNPAMMQFLEKFDTFLQQECADRELHLFRLACSTKARPRRVTFTLPNRSGYQYQQPLPFTLACPTLGGPRAGQLYVSQVDPGSVAVEMGLHRADRILALNDRPWDHRMGHQQAMEQLIKLAGTKICLTVIYEPLKYYDTMAPMATERHATVVPGGRKPRPTISSSGPECASKNGPPPLPPRHTKEEQPQQPPNCGNNKNSSSATRCRSAHNSPTRNQRQTQVPRGGAMTVSQHGQQQQQTNQHRSSSNPDLQGLFALYNGAIGGSASSSSSIPQVIRIWRSNGDGGREQGGKLISLTRYSTVHDAILAALREFGLGEEESRHQYSLYQVTVEEGPLVKQSRLAENVDDLAGRLTLNSRYYLKNNRNAEQLVTDEIIKAILTDSRVTLLQISPEELAIRLTLDDYEVFRRVEPTEYVDQTFQLSPGTSANENGGEVKPATQGYGTGHPNLGRFTDLVNREICWVPTELCSEACLNKRVDLLKKFIKTAKLCKELKNFNSLCCLMMGLSQTSVERLKQTWDKLSNKYHKMFRDLSCVLDPSRNFLCYRSMLVAEHCQPPLIPYLPLVTKDLTFIHIGNDSRTRDGLVNFVKLRMIAKEVRSVNRMGAVDYDETTIQHQLRKGKSGTVSHANNNPASLPCDSGGALATAEMTALSGSSTLKRSGVGRRRSVSVNPKRIYEEWLSCLRVRTYLANLSVIYNSDSLFALACGLEPQTQTQAQAPVPTSVPLAVTAPTGGGSGFTSSTSSIGSSITASSSADCSGSSSTSGVVGCSPRSSDSSSGSQQQQPPPFRQVLGAQSAEDARRLLALTESSRKAPNAKVVNKSPLKMAGGLQTGVAKLRPRPPHSDFGKRPTSQTFPCPPLPLNVNIRIPPEPAVFVAAPTASVSNSMSYCYPMANAGAPTGESGFKSSCPPPYEFAVLLKQQQHPHAVPTGPSVRPPPYPVAVPCPQPSQAQSPPSQSQARPPPPPYNEVFKQKQLKNNIQRMPPPMPPPRTVTITPENAAGNGPPPKPPIPGNPGRFQQPAGNNRGNADNDNEIILV